jgi:DNA-binding winged helix-turn-helix (wHTH) protein
VSARGGTIRFGPFELDVRAAELRKGQAKLRLQEQPFRILVMLLERPGEVVLREEIRDKLWPDGTVVDFEHSINAAVKRLRDTLRESAEKPRYIETLASRGYRFIGEVEESRSVPVIEAPPPEPVEVVSTRAPLPEEEAPEEAAAGHRNLQSRIARRWILIFGLFACLVLAGGLYYRQTAPARWAKNVALPEATRLVHAYDYTAAFPLIYRALQILPHDATLNRLRDDICYTTPIRTNPPGADIYLKAYGNPNGEWLYIGKSPLEKFRLPAGYWRWRIAKEGFRTVEMAAGIQLPAIEFALQLEGKVPQDMVYVTGGKTPSAFGDYWIDKYEVTNRQFKEFVVQGGYRNQAYWREEFNKDGRIITWEQAMAEFRDATGRPGPSTWQVGDYPQGRDDYPVGGVSWYEAAAYAEFAKKQLPTTYHWYRAAGQGIYSDILFFSNFDQTGPARAGSRLGVGAFGTYDMAGNVREWCWNATGNRRFILGGAWDDVSRISFQTSRSELPFQRSSSNGFRCVKYPGGAIPEVLREPVAVQSRDYRNEKPVSDSAFRILQRFYTYDRTDLSPTANPVKETSSYRRVERITFKTAYDRERVSAFLYLPKNSKPPYQTIVYYPAGHASVVDHIDEAEIKRFDFLVRSGRAVLFPVYQGTYERRPVTPLGPDGIRDETVQQCKDLLRSLDYLQTRQDISRTGIGIFAVSGGTGRALIAMAGESRIRAAVLVAAALPGQKRPPEIDPINFAPRVRTPVLMLNGRFDLLSPVEAHQNPLFDLLGTPTRDKRHILFESGREGPPLLYLKETMDWFDRYLGPVGN